MKNLLTHVPGATGKFAKNSGVGEDTLLFLLTSLDYRKYAHLPKPLMNFLAHDDSITINSFNTDSQNDLVDAYNHTKDYFLNIYPQAIYKSVTEARSGFNIIFWISWYLKTPSLIYSLFFNFIQCPKRKIFKKIGIIK